MTAPRARRTATEAMAAAAMKSEPITNSRDPPRSSRLAARPFMRRSRGERQLDPLRCGFDRACGRLGGLRPALREEQVRAHDDERRQREPGEGKRREHGDGNEPGNNMLYFHH